MKRFIKYLCPHTWFKKRELSFYGYEPYIHLQNYIIESKSYKRNWIKKSLEIFNNKMLEKNQNKVAGFHKCLGFADICNEGLIIKTTDEFAIETTNNEDDIKIHLRKGIVEVSSDGGVVYTGYNQPDLLFMDKNTGSNYSTPWGANPNVIKMTKKWYIDTPKDIQYLIIPVPYSDDKRFMACSGIQDPMKSRDLTLFFWWFPKNAYEVVKAGTPIAQIIPISKKKIYDSWKMYDFIPEKIAKEYRALTMFTETTKCTHYSKYKELVEKINQ